MSARISATWKWEEVAPSTFWLKVMATLVDQDGASLTGKGIEIYKAMSPTYFSYITTKTTNASGYIEYYFTGLKETNMFRFDFLGDANYTPSSTTITVEYLIDPPTDGPQCPTGYHWDSNIGQCVENEVIDLVKPLLIGLGLYIAYEALKEKG